MDYLQIGVAQNLIQFNDDKTRITYTNRNKTYNFKDPKETVRAETFVQLTEVYGYAPENIDFEVRVPRRTPNLRLRIYRMFTASLSVGSRFVCGKMTNYGNNAELT